MKNKIYIWKGFLTVLLATAILSSWPVWAAKQQSQGDTLLLLADYRYACVNGERIPIDTETGAAPYIQNGRTMVPMRFLAESLGASVQYEETAGKVTVNLAGNEIVLHKDNDTIFVNGEEKNIDAPPQVVNDRVFIPLRAVSECLNKQVFWDACGIIVISDTLWTEEKFQAQKAVLLNDLGLIKDTNITQEDEGLDDIQIIKNRIRSAMYSDSLDPAPIMEHMKPDGSFDNIDYRNNSPTEWAVEKHMDNLLSLGKAYNSPGNPYYHSEEVRIKYILGLINWVENDYKNTANLWYQSLGIPPKLANVILMGVPDIPQEVLDMAFNICRRGDIRIAYTRSHAGVESLATGGNLTNSCTISLKMAVAEEDDAYIREVLRELEKEILIFTPSGFTQEGEGLKVDYSFHQHLALMYNALYGYNFMDQIGTMIQWLNGTEYMLSDEALKEYVNFILEGQQWMFRGVNDDLNAVGRGIAQTTNSTYIGKGLPDVIKILLNVENVPRRDELVNLLNERLQGEDRGFTGNRYFWVSDYISHNRPLYHIGVRSSSKRTKPSEQINGENMLGYYLGDGVTMIQREGNEYSGTAPVWDWNKIPGTTTPQGALKELTFATWEWQGSTDFAGGVSDGVYGASCMDYEKDGVSAKKAWFMFDEGMVALGAGINYSGAFALNTSINQCALKTLVQVSDGRKTKEIPRGTEVCENTAWVLQDGVGYLFPKKSTVTIKNDVQTGRMSDINQYSTATAEAQLDMFNMWIDHGNSVINDEYAYIVIPGADSQILDAYTEELPLEIVSNTADIQAVYHNEAQVLEAVFRTAGSVKTRNGLSVSVDRPCVLMVREEGEKIQIAAANPMASQDTVKVTVNRKIQAQGASASGSGSVVTFALPGERYGGSTVLFDSQIGFWEPNHNRYHALQEEMTQKPQLIGITVDGEPLEGFRSEITGYSVPLSIENPVLPEIKAFGAGGAEILKDDEKHTVRICMGNAEEENQTVYLLNFYIPPKEGEPEDALELEIQGVTAGQVPQPENGPENTIDGVILDSSRWSASGDDVWIQYDLGEEKSVDYVAMAAAFGDTRSTVFRIVTSKDGENWTEVYNGKTSGTTNRLETYPISPSSARYVRIYGYGSDVSAWTSITEVKIYTKSMSG